MNSGERLQGVVQHFRTKLGDNTATDRELLARYAHQRDEAAFTALVKRHGRLVFGVARRQLCDGHQAEDVFQATFLALARSAARLGKPGSLANWLYTVAVRLARKARLRAARRSAHEKTLTPRPASTPDPLAQLSGRELLDLIDEELARLPEAHRLPLLLCCVQGLSREEAARQLGWTDGAVKGRLERGRRQLAARLARRGLAPSALVLAPLASAAVPSGLLANTAALAAAPWSKTIPAAVLALAAIAAPSKLLPAVALLGSLLIAGLVGLAIGSGQEEPASADPAPADPAPAAARAAPAAVAPEDPLPAGSSLRFGTSRFRHGTAIDGLAVTADGRLAVAASGSHWLGSTRAFDLSTGRVLYALDRSGYAVEGVAFSPDGRTVATRQGDAIHLSDAATGKQLRKIALPTANPRSITQWLTLSPDGKTLAITSDGKTIQLIDIDKGTVLRSLAHQHVVFAAAFSPDGRLLAAGGYDSEGNTYFARIWQVAGGKELRRCNSGAGGIRTLAFSPDGTILAGGGDDGRLRLWEAASGKEKRVFPADGRGLRSVAYAPDGRTVAAAAASIHLYDPTTGEERLRIDRQASGLHFSADGRTLTAAVAGAIYRWNAVTGRLLTPQAAGDSGVDQIVVTPDGRKVITRDQEGKAHVWDAATGEHLRRLDVAWQRGIALSSDGRYLAWSVADPSVKFKDPEDANSIYTGKRIRLYDLGADKLLDLFPGFKGDAHSLTFTADGKTLVSVDHRDGGVRLWDVAGGTERRMFRALPADKKPSRPYSIWRPVLSPDGKTLAVDHQRDDNTTAFFGSAVVRLWDVASGKKLHELTGHVNQVLDLAFSPDSRLLVSCGENPSDLRRLQQRSPTDCVFVWDVAAGERLLKLPEGLAIGAGSVSFAPDGRTLATASADGLLRIWEIATWTVRAEFRGHRDRVSALAFAPDGRLLSGSMDTTVLSWDLRPPRASVAEPLTTAWDELARTEAAPAFKAQGRLRAAPAKAVTLLAARLKPAEPVDAKRLAALIADLDRPQFAMRQKATDALKQLGKRAATALRQATQKAASEELRRRTSALLADMAKSPPLPEELQALRAVEALEWIATSDARQLLAELSKGDPDAELTRTARAALKRLK